MSEQENLDISRVVGLIMENPGLIEQISNLARSAPAETAEAESPPADEVQTEAAPIKEEAVSATPTYPPHGGIRGDRARLLGALKPYVSKERAKAIDSMISIADILDMMRSR
nr:hypothetical protein [Oscillospiraceae bacterium]